MERPWIMEKLTRQMIRHEGLRLKTYYCTAGKLTVGIGHNLSASPIQGLYLAGQEISEADALAIFQKDMEKAEIAMLTLCPWLRDLDDPRYAVMLNMTFNLGITGLSRFRATLGAVQSGDYRSAAVQMLNSKRSGQVGKFPPDSPLARKIGRPGRAWELAEQMCTGKWQGV